MTSQKLNLNLLNKAFVTMCALLFSYYANAISVGQSVVYFDAGKAPQQNVLIYNNDKSKAYVKTEVFEVINPGTAEEKRIKASGLGDLKLLVSPSKMIIPPGGKKSARFSYLSNYQAERIFRVSVTPVPGKSKGTGSGISLLIGYQILVVVSPQGAKHNIISERDGESIVFKNIGNSNVLFSKAKLCPKKDTPSEQCKVLQISKRMYPNNQWKVNVPNGKYIEFTLFDGVKSEKKVKRFY